MRLLNACAIALCSATLLTSTSAQALPRATHAYGLNGTYADELGGPPLVPQGGFLGLQVYNFAAGQGLVLSNAVNPSTYSIEFRLKIKTITSARNAYVKLIDWLDRTSDTGLYNRSGYANFYNVIEASAPTIVANKYFDCTITRNGPTKEVRVYIQGVLQFRFVDGGNLAMTAPGKNIIRFVQDDFRTSEGEDADGAIDHIRIFNVVLSAKDASDLAKGLLPPNVRQK